MNNNLWSDRRGTRKTNASVPGNVNRRLFIFHRLSSQFKNQSAELCQSWRVALPMALSSAGSVRQSPEDEFYANLTLGLVKFLNSIQRITNITLNKQQPSERTQITTWEQRHNVYLADDMRRFYLSTDGFTLHWSYQYSRNVQKLLCQLLLSFLDSFFHTHTHIGFSFAANDVRRVGYINFPHIRQITLLKDYLDIISASSQLPATQKRSNETNCDEPHLTSRSKIFELSNIYDMAKANTSGIY